MSYYLRTLEGVGGCLGYVNTQYLSLFVRLVDDYYKRGYGIQDRYIAAWNDFVEQMSYWGDGEFSEETRSELKNAADYIKSFEGLQNMSGFIQLANNLYNAYSRRYTKYWAAAGASEEAAARGGVYDIESEIEKERIERERATAEAAAKAQEAAAAQIMEKRTMTTTELEPQVSEETEEIQVTPQVISAEHEFTVIDETDETIVYQDETGKMYVEQKPKTGLGWLIVAGVAALVLL